MRYQFALSNRLGNRSSNQDRCAVRHGEHGVLLLVADGMGGHERGDLAAQTALDTFSRAFSQHKGAIKDPAVFLRKTMEQAHDRVVEVGMAQHPPIEPRTTFVAGLVQGDRAWWAHVGDSRLYLLRAGKVRLRTRDHAHVEELLQSGAISEDEARHHPMRNCVSQCLGGATTSPDVALGDVERLQPDDCLLLCSDGLWSALPQEELVKVTRAKDLNEGLEQLAEDAERAAYPHSDNISAVLLRWLEHDEAGTGTDRPARGVVSSDPLDAAIDEINRALAEYGNELKPSKK